jgi:hypothetical protein
VLSGVFGLFARAIARWWTWRGDARYLALAVLAPLALGTLLLVLGAAELAWPFLLSALAIAALPVLPRWLVPVALVTSALPLLLLLYPLRLREAAWNGFYPPDLPLAAALGFFAAPTVAAIGFVLRRRPSPGPMGTLVLGVGCGLAVLVGLVVAVTLPNSCTAVKFARFHLACERV